MAELFIKQPGPVAAIGLALIERLKLVFPPARFDHQFVPVRLDAAAWRKLLRRTPFIGVGFVGIEAKPGTGSQFSGTVTWPIFLVTKNESGPQQRFFGDAAAPGALEMMQVAIAALQGIVLTAGGTNLGTVTVQSAANAFADDWSDDTVALIALEASVPVNFTVGDVLGGEATVAQSLAGTTVQWSFDGGASVALTDQTTGGV